MTHTKTAAAPSAPVAEARRVAGSASTPTNKALAVASGDVSLDRMTADAALAMCKSSPERVADLLMAIIRRNTTALPDTCFIRRDDDVYLKKVRVGVRLTESEKHIIGMGYGDNKDWFLALGGLRKMNEVAALATPKPSQIAVEGKLEMNPFVKTDPKTGNPIVVYARSFAVGYSPTGSLVATDATIRLDLNIYMLENIQSKMKKLMRNSPTGAERLGEYGTSDAPPVNEDGRVRAGKWKFLPIHSVGDMGLWVNMAAPEFYDIFSDHTSKMKKIAELGQSFAERNALKAHPAMQSGLHVVNGVAIVQMTGWTTDFDRADMDKLRELIEADKIQDFSDRTGQHIRVEAVTQDTVDDEARVTLDQEVKDQDAADRHAVGGDTKPDDAESGGQGVDPLLVKASTLYGQLAEKKPRGTAKSIMSACGIAGLEEATPDELGAFIAKAEEALASAT